MIKFSYCTYHNAYAINIANTVKYKEAHEAYLKK